jgi:hypothetical protein
MKLFLRRWFWIPLIGLGCGITLGYHAYHEVDRQQKEMLESKWVRTSPATVLSKTDGRVYYQIENFDALPEPRRGKALASEANHVRDSGPRCTYSVAWYDRVDVGSQIYVRYQCFSDGHLEIVGTDVGKPR